MEAEKQSALEKNLDYEKRIRRLEDECTQLKVKWMPCM